MEIKRKYFDFCKSFRDQIVKATKSALCIFKKGFKVIRFEEKKVEVGFK